jgi:hypothetical protein
MALFARSNRELIDEQLCLRVTREGNHIRVVVADRSMLFTGTSPEQFVQDYRAALHTIELEFGSTQYNRRTLEFSSGEQNELRRDIALHWIRYYLSTHQRVQIRPKDLQHPQTWTIVLKRAEAKYGPGSQEAMALAARAVGSDLQQFARWRRVEDDRIAKI